MCEAAIGSEVKTGPGSASNARAAALSRVSNTFRDAIKYAKQYEKKGDSETSKLASLSFKGTAFHEDDGKKYISLLFPTFTGGFLRTAIVSQLLTSQSGVLPLSKIVCSNGDYSIRYHRPEHASLLSDFVNQAKQAKQAKQQPHPPSSLLYPFSQEIVKKFMIDILNVLITMHGINMVHGSVCFEHILCENGKEEEGVAFHFYLFNFEHSYSKTILRCLKSKTRDIYMLAKCAIALLTGLDEEEVDVIYNEGVFSNFPVFKKEICKRRSVHFTDDERGKRNKHKSSNPIKGSEHIDSSLLYLLWSMHDIDIWSVPTASEVLRHLDHSVTWDYRPMMLMNTVVSSLRFTGDPFARHSNLVVPQNSFQAGTVWRWATTSLLDDLHTMKLGRYNALFQHSVSLLYIFMHTVPNIGTEQLPALDIEKRSKRVLYITTLSKKRAQTKVILDHVLLACIRISSKLNSIARSEMETNDHHIIRRLNLDEKCVSTLEEVIFNTLSPCSFYAPSFFTFLTSCINYQSSNRMSVLIRSAHLAIIFIEPVSPLDIFGSSCLTTEYAELIANLGKQRTKAPMLKRALVESKTSTIFSRWCSSWFSDFEKDAFETHFNVTLTPSDIVSSMGTNGRINTLDWLIGQLDF